MNEHLNSQERELVKAANNFKKRAQNLIRAGKLGEEHKSVAEACDKLLAQVYAHAENRAFILQQHQNLKKIVQDNAQCPKCKSSTFLKLRGVEVNEKGWKRNKYKCRKCNIEFVWNRPNNPWDMLKFIDEFVIQIDQNLQNEPMTVEAKAQTEQVKANMLQNLDKLKPVVESVDKNLQDVKNKDKEMAQMLHDFKNYLLIETIKLDTWENQKDLN